MDFVILLVEDDDDDAMLFRRAVKLAGLDEPLLILSDGAQALEYLAQAALGRGKEGIPRLMVLDLGLPRVSGFQVLEWCRQQRGLRDLPMIVLSGCLSPADVTLAYQLGANAFVEKPAEHADLVRAVEGMARFWAGPVLGHGADSALAMAA